MKFTYHRDPQTASDYDIVDKLYDFMWERMSKFSMDYFRANRKSAKDKNRIIKIDEEHWFETDGVLTDGIVFVIWKGLRMYFPPKNKEGNFDYVVITVNDDLTQDDLEERLMLMLLVE